MPPSKPLIPLKALPPVRRSFDPVLIAGAVGFAGFAGALGGWLWAGLAGMGAGTFLYAQWQQQRQLDHQRMAQENLTHFLHSASTPEDLATLRGAADLMDKDLYEFLGSIVTTYGGESVRGTGRIPGDEQTEAVAPGIALTLAHDLGFWYAKLQLSGDCGRRFLNGEMTQWKARGRTPAEAVEAVMRKAGASRQRVAIQEYAQRMVQDRE